MSIVKTNNGQEVEVSDNYYDWILEDYIDEYCDYLYEEGRDSTADTIYDRVDSDENKLSESYFKFIKKNSQRSDKIP